MSTQLDIRQSQTRVLQDQLASAATLGMDSVLASINSELTVPGRLIAQSTPSLVVSVNSGSVANPQTGKNRVLPFINNTPVSFAGGTITFPSTSGTITVSPGVNSTITIGASQFVAVLVQLDATGNLNLVVGAAAGSLGATVIPAGSSSFLSLGYIIAQSNGSSVIQSITNTMLYQFGTGGGAGASGSGSGTGDDLDALNFRASFADKFTESATVSTTSINGSTGFTNAVYNGAKNMYAMSYDASKTATTTSTAVTISAAPAFTVAVGDVVVRQSTGEVKKITVVSSQTSYTIESAFAANLAAEAVTVSQAVHTKDLYNIAIDSNGNTLSSAFSGASFSEIIVDYTDNATAGNNTPLINSVPVVADSASGDNSTWTNLQTRVTNDTDTVQSFSLSAAGTSLYLRFFANKTSGSGTVNLLYYKTFLQKAVTSGSANSIQNASYCLSNGGGSPVNCSVAVVGGKTTITLSFNYAVGVNAGSPYGSLDVYVNGQLIPRFISSGNNPTGAYYTEVSGNVLQLDGDYSSVGVPIEILQRLQVIDTSTANTSAISVLQDTNNQGFQPFVNTANSLNATSVSGSPATGKFYSSISNRAAIVDITQDLKAKMGIERVMTQQIYQIQNEFGPNGEPVWATPNDTNNQIRFVGTWANTIDGNGTRQFTTVATDYIEVTFYGTGLNLLAYLDATNRDIRVSIDGGTETSNLAPSSVSAVLGGRGYAKNSIINLASGLTLGVHTAKIRENDTNSFNAYGFEIVNESSLVKVNPGIAYSAGLKLSLAAQSSLSYSAAVTGTRGGRVLEYLSSLGVRTQAFQAVNSTQANLTSADHTNEEVARVYHFREFGAARSDDFSLLSSSTSSTVFTLDDGTTTLLGSSVFVDTSNGNYLAISNASSGFFIAITFVGTGLDIIRQDSTAGTSPQHDILIDGTNVGSLSTAASNNKRQVKIVSGLPYGTHTVKILRQASGGINVGIQQVIVYQPKKPSLPSGAIELADYNVMATYVANAIASLDTVGTGILRKFSNRELTYVDGTGGTTSWNISSVTPASYVGGLSINSDRTNAFFTYVFYGTGVELRFDASGTKSSNISVSLQALSTGGSLVAATTTNFPGLVSSAYGGGSFSAGVLSQNNGSTTPGAGVSISGLPLGLYLIKLNNNTASSFFTVQTVDVITPIHSAKSNLFSDLQNTLLVGSNAISDNRKTTPVKDILPVAKAWAQAVGITSAPTTTSTVWVPVPDLSCTVKTTGGPLQIAYDITTISSSTSVAMIFQVYVDGVAVGTTQQSALTNSSVVSDLIMVPVSPGVHKVDVYWELSSAGTGTASGNQRSLKVREL